MDDDDVHVRGVTSVSDELFVLLERDDDFNDDDDDDDVNQVAVYSITDYQLRRHLSVPGYSPGVHSDMTSCVRHKCLYMSDHGDSCIHRYVLASGAIGKWSVPGKPLSLSVTPRGNLLVTYQCKLVELSAESGQCVRVIAVQTAIVFPWHSVQLTTGQYVVCHGVYNSGLQRVCVVGDDGKVTRSYGGQSGSEVGQLHQPYHMAVDEDSQSIFVADSGNDRVVLLSPTLEFARYVTEGLSSLYFSRLYFHQATRRLFVSKGDDAITVVQL